MRSSFRGVNCSMQHFPPLHRISEVSGVEDPTGLPGRDACRHLMASPQLTRPQRLVLALLRGYQLALSPLFAGSCRFVPSCSAYATEAVRRFGVIRGSWLACRRLARCRPLAAHGFDPVPGSPIHD